MSKIEEIKQLLMEAEVYKTTLSKDSRLTERAGLAFRICGKFPKSSDNPDGYEITSAKVHIVEINVPLDKSLTLGR